MAKKEVIEEVIEEVTHESLIKAITDSELALKEAQKSYKVFCKANPLKLPKQLTNHEIRIMRQKNDKLTLADHQKANKAAASSAQKEQLKQELKGG